MAKRGRRADKGPTLIIRREGGEEQAHHGGAWKVAYADFVTAMMAFFLIMWLLNATTEDQRKGLADYFSPSNLLSHASSGTGHPFGGKAAFEEGALVSNRGSVQVIEGTRPVVVGPETDQADDPAVEDSSGGRLYPADTIAAPPPGRPLPVALPAGKGTSPTASAPAPSQPGAQAPPVSATTPNEPPPAAKPAQATEDTKQFQHAAEEIHRKLATDPALAGLAKQVLVDVTPKGLRVQLLDAEHQSMFASGSPEPNERAQMVIRKLVPVLQDLPGGLAIEGHTDAAPYPGPERTNWELSAERANAARRMLTEAGIPGNRIQEVTGHADHDLLLADQPLAPANRRITIIVLRTAANTPN